MIEKLRHASQSLTFRIAALLALALLPIGLISLLTTSQLLSQADRRAEANLLALTADAAAPEEAFIRTGIGAANAMASMVPLLRESGWECEMFLQDFLRRSEAFAFAGYVNREGIITCASSGLGIDASERPIYREMRRDPRTRVTIAENSLVSRMSVILITVPVMTNGEFDGYVVVSLPHGKLFRPLEQLSKDRPLDLVTFNAEAEVLTASRGVEKVGPHLPANHALADLRYDKDTAFIDVTNNGFLRVFAVIPIVPGQVFALGSWEHNRRNFIGGASITSSLLFPMAMWLACLGVAFFAVQRMVIRPTRNLRARMLQFMRSRRIVEPRHESATPRELREMEQTWMRLAENVLHDEAELYDTIHQRTVLLKEVHHRVKNNLQLIISILNMKIRKARQPEVREAMSDIRQRVMGIARVHQELYETSTTERVHAGELLRALVAQSLRSSVEDEAAIEFREHYEDLVVYPDQAVPLSLAVTELVTNALKHLAADDGQKPRLSIRLIQEESGWARVEIENTLGPRNAIPDTPPSGGLGMALVNAFVQQLEGTTETTSDAEHYRVTLRFPIADFDDTKLPGELAWAD